MPSSSASSSSSSSSAPSLPLWYRLFFLWVEPAATLAGAYYAFFEQQQYLELTHSPSAPNLYIPLGTSIALTQLANLYLLFALSEALILRSTSDLAVWRALLVGMLIADLGHLYSVGSLGLEVYYDVQNWNAIDYGNVAFVYVGALTRSAFLLGVGLSSESGPARSIKALQSSRAPPRSPRSKKI